MKRYTHYLLALVLGVILTVVSAYLAGIIAALPIPRLSAQFRHDHARLILLLMDLAAALPLGILAWIVGRIFFRAIGTSSPLLWALAALPWVLYVAAGEIDYLYASGFSFNVALAVLLGWAQLSGLITGVLSVPVGLWWASKAKRKHVGVAL
jgi:hypothetical protein